MKKINFLLALPLLFSSAAFAAPISSPDEVNGTWHLDYTKRTVDDATQRPSDQTWVFQGNTLTIKGIEQMRDAAYDSTPANYVVEGGNIKVPIMGRPGKFDIYEVIEKNDSGMVLKDVKFGSYSYFTKK